ncbi:MAG: hypothetical protein ABJA66_15955 [Actinomycetota bacterium]
MKSYFNYFLVLILMLVGSYIADAQEFRIPGNTPRWIDTGINVVNGTQVTITASGTVNVGARGDFGPEGTTAFPEDRRLSFPSDTQPLYGLAFRFTSSRTNPDDELREDYPLPPNGSICSGSTGHLWLIVNDDVRADNTGVFIVNITTGSCTPRDTRLRETRIRVADGQNANIKDAEVFVNGRRVGTTDINGILRLPPLSVGDRIVARSRIQESRSYRSNHQTGSTQNWNYRVYLTTATIGNDGTRADFVVSNPLDTQELRLNPSNPLFGLHILASLEWDASRVELDNMRDQMLVPMSQFLYNATDGQFFVEQIELADNAAFWDDTDLRVHANLEVRPNVNLRRGGFLHSGLATWMNMRRGPTLTPDSWFSAITAAHEFGHYGFDLGDEYADGDPSVFCATNLSSGGAFGNNQPQASCMMFSQFRAGKLCSGRGENRHRTGTRQGDETCWFHLANQYRDGSDPFRARWFINTPETRGTIPGSVPALPADWQPRVAIENRSRPNLCQPITMTVTNADTRDPMDDVEVWVRTPSGQNILQGKSGGYESGGGRIPFGTGNIPITGVHVGDRVTANGGEYVITTADCSETARLDEKFLKSNSDGWFMTNASFSPFFTGKTNKEPAAQKTISLVIAPEPFALTASVEPVQNGQLQIRVKADRQLGSAPQVAVTQQGSTEPQKITMTFDEAGKSYVGTIGKLFDVAYADIEVTASIDGKSVVKRFFSAVVSPLNPNDETEIFSTDGQLSVSIPSGAMPAGTRISVSPSSIAPPSLDSGFVVVSGGYNIAASTGGQMNREGVVRFQLANRKGNRAADGFDPNTFEILRYNRQNQKWESAGGTFLPEVDVISVKTNQLGDYAVIARSLNGSTNGQKNNEKKSSAQLTVTDAGLKADQPNISGKCPVTVKFTGFITTNAPGTVKYTFTRSDGATGPVYSLDFKEAGTQTVSTGWTLGGTGLQSFEGWQGLKILSPNELETNAETGRFVMKCEQ